MAKGLSLHIGVNAVDPTHYKLNMQEGWEGKLKGCEADAKKMRDIAIKNNFKASLLTTAQATTEAVTTAIKKAADTLEKGDYFLISYSGHGGQVLDTSKDERKDNDLIGGKKDTTDETWCLYDRQLLDDELQQLWATFKEGVCILFFSDSCHSGTSLRGDLQNLFLPPKPTKIQDRVAPKSVFTDNFTDNYTYMDNLELYTSLQGPEERPEIVANIISFAACQDDQIAREDQSEESPGGLFTKSVIKTLEAGEFTDYASFFERIEADMADLTQTPKFLKVGDDDNEFGSQMPFKLG